MPYQGFEQLEVWKKAREFKNAIAEGHGRRTYPDRLRFCIIARGSLSETLNHLIDAFDSKYISIEVLYYFRNKIEELKRILNGYINFMENKISNKQ